MRFLRVLIVAVAGLVVCGIVVDSYAARVPIRDIGIPIYLGDPDDVNPAKPRDGIDSVSKQGVDIRGGGGYVLLVIRIFSRYWWIIEWGDFDNCRVKEKGTTSFRLIGVREAHAH